jgi:hypothetical protein
VLSVAPSATATEITEAAALSVCGAVVFVVDSTEEAPYAESMEALRRTAAVLMAMAAARSKGGGQPVSLPQLEIFIHKVDGDAWGAGGGPGGSGGGGIAVGGGGAAGGVSDEGRAELLREVSLAVLRELRDAGACFKRVRGVLRWRCFAPTSFSLMQAF